MSLVVCYHLSWTKLLPDTRGLVRFPQHVRGISGESDDRYFAYLNDDHSKSV